jgi:hypothetical protein
MPAVSEPPETVKLDSVTTPLPATAPHHATSGGLQAQKYFRFSLASSISSVALPPDDCCDASYDAEPSRLKVQLVEASAGPVNMATGGSSGSTVMVKTTSEVSVAPT